MKRAPIRCFFSRSFLTSIDRMSEITPLNTSKVYLHLFHVLGVVPFFFYIAITRSALPEFVFNFLIVLGIFLILVHLYKGYLRYYNGSTYLWVNLLHALLVGPLLIYIGVHKKTTPRMAYEALMLLAFGAFGYQMKLLAEDLNFIKV